MKWIWLIVFSSILISFSNLTFAGKYADATGLYHANKNGECKSQKIYGKKLPDTNISGVCVPNKTLMNENLKPMIYLGIVELTNPENLHVVERIQQLRSEPTDASKVEIDSFENNKFELVDGSVLKKTDSSYVGYIGYHEKAIFYRDINQWKLCINGESYKVDVIKDVKYGYSRDSINASVNDIEKMDECK
ncbi:hypothetical protein [Erwinia sp. V71]|uniref:hypothetical protein n=1 Tax=Erwinia sp. V71 TaxID=3369424 RepID=UPI003F63C67A